MRNQLQMSTPERKCPTRAECMRQVATGPHAFCGVVWRGLFRLNCFRRLWSTLMRPSIGKNWNLKGRTIGVQGSTNAEAFVQEYFGEGVEIRIYDKQNSPNLNLVAERIDEGWQTSPSGRHFSGRKTPPLRSFVYLGFPAACSAQAWVSVCKRRTQLWPPNLVTQSRPSKRTVR